VLSPDLEAALARAQVALREHWEPSMAPNIRDLDIDLISDALEMTGSGGPCVVWVPRTAIVKLLVGFATFDER
jgi:hypothetical protein